MLYLQWEVSRMPWREVTRMLLREEFVKLAMQEGANRRELCRRFGIAPKTGYKWLQRYALGRPRRSQGSLASAAMLADAHRAGRRTACAPNTTRGAWLLGRTQGGPTAGPRGRPRTRAEHYQRYPAPPWSAQSDCAGAASLSAL